MDANNHSLIHQYLNLKLEQRIACLVTSRLTPYSLCNYLQTAAEPCCPRFKYSKITQPRTLLPTLGDQVRGGSTSADLAVRYLVFKLTF